MGTIAVSFSGVRSTTPHPFADHHTTLLSKLGNPHNHLARTNKLTHALWSPVTYKPNTTRRNANVSAVNAYVLDLDGIHLDAVRDLLVGLEWVAYSTWSHSPQKPSFHVVLPLVTPVAADAWPATWRKIDALFGSVGDPAAKDPSRAYFCPQHHPDRAFHVERGFGRLLDVRGLPAVPMVRKPKAESLSHRTYGDAADFTTLDGLEGAALAAAGIAIIDSILNDLRAA